MKNIGSWIIQDSVFLLMFSVFIEELDGELGNTGADIFFKIVGKIEGLKSSDQQVAKRFLNLPTFTCSSKMCTADRHLTQLRNLDCRILRIMPQVDDFFSNQMKMEHK